MVAGGGILKVLYGDKIILEEEDDERILLSGREPSAR